MSFVLSQLALSELSQAWKYFRKPLVKLQKRQQRLRRDLPDEVSAVAGLLSGQITNEFDLLREVISDKVFLALMHVVKAERHQSRQQKHDTEIHHVLFVFLLFCGLTAKLLAEVCEQWIEIKVKRDRTYAFPFWKVLVLDVMSAEQTFDQRGEAH